MSRAASAVANDCPESSHPTPTIVAVSYEAVPRCGNCGETFEDLVGTERAELPACPNCGATDE